MITFRSLAIALAVAVMWPATARAFCGFYVSGADAKMSNNATMVAMMRDGTLTVLSMQNNYKGPPQDFALVVPVPVVLQKDNVKILEPAVFDRLDRLAAPRLVEYWERDPCRVLREEEGDTGVPRLTAPVGQGAGGGRPGVRVEAQFSVGEYEVVILSAQDSSGLDTWLRSNDYKIPDTAEELLRPYVQQGMKFFVAKVDVAKVKFEVDGTGERSAMLSPLRFHYHSEDFSLPVRLGLLNADGAQDLIVHILAKGSRYEVANYDNVTIPTNLRVDDGVRKRFAEFYAALFDATLAKNPKAVVTEYAWDAFSCDPCPVPPLREAELLTLGSDQIEESEDPKPQDGCMPGDPLCGALVEPTVRPRVKARDYVLTRLHARYGKDALGEDLRFRKAGPIVGGREFRRTRGQLEKGSQPGERNNFQGRYAIRHRWKGPVACDQPLFGVWGGPPEGETSRPPAPATQLAFAPRGQLVLPKMLRQDVPELGLRAVGDPNARAGGGEGKPEAPREVPVAPELPVDGSACGCAVPGRGDLPGRPVAWAFALALLVSRRRRDH